MPNNPRKPKRSSASPKHPSTRPSPTGNFSESSLPSKPLTRQKPAASQDADKGARTGWDSVASWYNGWVGKDGSLHHRKLAIPTALKLLDLKRGESILDIGAGQGVFAPYVLEQGGVYTGVDVSPRLLDIARQQHGKSTKFYKADACKLASSRDLEAASFDAVVFLLSIQDINPLPEALYSAAWALKPGGRAVLLMTHPCFRIPRQSGWGHDDNRKLTFRRIDRYLTPLSVPMKPYQGGSGVTISFHRPLHEYVNGLAAAHLLVERIEEVTSYKTDENPAEAEFPLFLGIRARKVL